MTLPVKLNEVQSEAVKSLSMNATADTILFFFTTRKRLSRVTDLDMLKKDIEKEGFKLNIQDYKAFFGNMETQGFGVMKHPRDSSDMGSFYWDYSLRTVGKVVYPSDNEQEKNKIARILKSREILGSPTSAPEAKTEAVTTVETPKAKRGRPAGSKNKLKEIKAKGRQGRPKGSKNKPKQATIVLPGVSQSNAKVLQQALVAMLKSA